MAGGIALTSVQGTGCAVEMIKVVDLEKDSLYSGGEFEEFSNLSLYARQSSVQFLDFAVKSAIVLFSLLFHSLFEATFGTEGEGSTDFCSGHSRTLPISRFGLTNVLLLDVGTCSKLAELLTNVRDQIT